MVVEPSQKDLVRSQTQQIIYSLSLLAQTIQLRMDLDIDLCKQAATNNLPDQPEDQMLATLCNIGRANINDGTSDSFGGGNDDIVVLCHLECIERLAGSRLVEYTRINSFWYGVVDEFTEDQAVSAFVEQLHGMCRDR